MDYYWTVGRHWTGRFTCYHRFQHLVEGILAKATVGFTTLLAMS